MFKQQVQNHELHQTRGSSAVTTPNSIFQASLERKVSDEEQF
jgi:hypothetical protein